jgi:hypothetical protein
MPNELAERVTELAGEGHYVRHEPLANLGNATGRYVDPLVYIFWARTPNGSGKLCYIIQFKTYPCRDKLDVEITSLRTGHVIYRFGNGNHAVRLLTLICSDVFQFNNQLVEEQHRNSIILHIQLNPKPADENYSRYRSHLIQVGSKSRVELLCLNWAAPIEEKNESGQIDSWKNNSGSAFYVPQDGCRPQDADVVTLHRSGVYYCVNNKKAKWHTFYLNRSAHAILLQKEKVFYNGPVALEPQFCLRVSQRWRWDGGWIEDQAPDDGFADALAPYTALSGPFLDLAAHSPLSVERAIELLTIPEDKTSEWHALQQLGAMHVALPESIRRVTVDQEPDPDSNGRSFRKLRFERAQAALTLTGAGVPWPGSVADLEQGFVFGWNARDPHRNVTATASGKLATVIFLGDESDDNAVEAAFRLASQHVRRHAAKKADEAGANMQDAAEEAGSRVCVIYRRNNRLAAKGPSQHYDRSPDRSMVDIAGETND